jgi:hypothetical protein
MCSGRADSLAALNGGYHIAFLLGPLFPASAGVLSKLNLRVGEQRALRET